MNQLNDTQMLGLEEKKGDFLELSVWLVSIRHTFF